MATAITHDRIARTFATVNDGHKGYLRYEKMDYEKSDGQKSDGQSDHEKNTNGRLVITHTVVPLAIGGRGIAGDLVKHALDFARSEGLKVLPQCSYAADYIRKHPEYADLAA